MSLATNIKDFADVLHNIYAQQLSSIDTNNLISEGVLPLAIPKIVVLQQACLHAAKSFSSGIFYFLSFQWLRDFSYFPLISPESGNESSVAHDTFLSEPFSYLFSFSKDGVALSSYPESVKNGALGLEQFAGVDDKKGFTQLLMGTTPAMQSGARPLGTQGIAGFLKTDQVVAGVVNSFFFSLPFSLPHLITLRRLFSQGSVAAVASIFGTVAAHSLLIVGVVYGVRFCVVPYYSLQPWTFWIQLITIAVVIAEFVKEKRVYLVPSSESSLLIRVAIINFVLSLCESSTVFHDLHHLTLNQQVSYLQLYSSQTALDSFFIHLAYVIAFVLGHAVFSFLTCFCLLKGYEKICSLTGWTLPQTARRINRVLLVAIVTLTFSSFPYYGLDYLVTKGAGFLPEDPAYRNTIFSPTQVRSRNRHFKSRAPATKNSKTPLELDLAYFDRGMYLNAPKEEKMTSDLDIIEDSNSSTLPKSEVVATYDPALTFEELNYQGESAWLMRHERAKRLPESQDSKNESVFQKPKTYFKQLKLNQEAKQAERALKEGSQIGSISKWKEGSRVGESISLYNGGAKQDFESESNATFRKEDRSRPQRGNKFAFAEGDGVQSNALPSIAGKGRWRSQQEIQAEDGAYTYQNQALLRELSFEKEMRAAYEQSFASPFGEESDGTPPDLLPVENIIKKRYRLNPIYRALLKTDIDFFISRQPVDYRITQNQEASLFKKRQLLEKYYNSIRYYSPVENVTFSKRLGSYATPDTHLRKGDLSHKGEVAFTKSFVERLYHQQFKGTLSTVKRFFKVTFDGEQNPSKNRILSYDQPLYKTDQTVSILQKDKSGVLKGRASYQTSHPSLHEELYLERGAPFIEESNSAPIYAGWDDKARRFVVTNRCNLLVA